MMTDMAKEEDNQTPVSEKFTYVLLILDHLYRLECIKNSDVKITHKYTLGDLSM